MNPINKKRRRNSEARTLELFELMKKGDKQAREEIVLDHLNVVKHFAKKYSKDVDSFHNIYDEGVIGLLKAVDRFDPSVGVKFVTYAYPYIQGCILEYIRYRDEEKDQPLKARDYKILIAINKALDEKDRYLTYPELAEMTGYDVKEVELVMETATNKTRLESIMPDTEESLELKEMIDCGVNVEEEALSNLRLKAVFDELGEMDSLLINRYYVDGMGQSEIARETGISQAQVCRKLKKATQRFKEVYLAY